MISIFFIPPRVIFRGAKIKIDSVIPNELSYRKNKKVIFIKFYELGLQASIILHLSGFLHSVADSSKFEAHFSRPDSK